MRFLLFYFCLLPQLAVAQQEDYIWVFGGFEDFSGPDSAMAMTVVDFRESPPKMDFVFEFKGFVAACTNVSDADGNLLLYSNGVHIFNADHEIIENGEEFQSSSSWIFGYGPVQSALLLPYPGHPERFVFLLVDLISLGDVGPAVSGASPLTYSTIDMENGEWKVTEKRNILSSDTIHYNNVMAVQHANGRDWWVITKPMISDNTYRKFLLTPEGISLYDKQQVGGKQEWVHSHAAISPEGDRLAYYLVRNDTLFGAGVELMDFDRCTGQISNYSQMTFEDEGATGGTAFSPDGTKLYVSDRDEVYQFDLEAPDIKASRQLVAEYDGFLDEFGQKCRFGLMKLAPNGKIYICSTTVGTQYMHVIDNPNEAGTACNVLQHSVFLPTRNYRTLPNHPTYRLGPLEGSPCDTIDFTPTLEQKVESTVRIYPNPVEQGGEWLLDYRPINNNPATLKIFNSMGQVVFSKGLALGGKYSIPTNDLTIGLYFYEVNSGRAIVGSGKVVVRD